jgi:hypothetical protein
MISDFLNQTNTTNLADVSNLEKHLRVISLTNKAAEQQKEPMEFLEVAPH